MHPQPEPIYIQMLGSFHITSQNASISEKDARTKQLWHLLQYLIAFRHKHIPKESLIDIMWPEGNIENPNNALKNLVYRLRNVFTKAGLPHAKDIIIYSGNTYQWNNLIPCVVDSEEFEEHYQHAQNQNLTTAAQLQEYEAAMELYQGDFLPNSQTEEWVIPISSHLKTIFFKCAYTQIELLNEQDCPDKYNKIIATCRKILSFDKLEEDSNLYLIEALYRTGQQEQAIAHYQTFQNMFFTAYGRHPKRLPPDLYHIITQGMLQHKKQAFNPSVNASEGKTQPEQALFCNYDLLKRIYYLEARKAARNGNTIYLCMLTLDSISKRQIPHVACENIMKILSQAMLATLPENYVFSKFSSMQYIILVPVGTAADCEKIMKKTTHRFKKDYANPDIQILIKLTPLEPFRS